MQTMQLAIVQPCFDRPRTGNKLHEIKTRTFHYKNHYFYFKRFTQNDTKSFLLFNKLQSFDLFIKLISFGFTTIASNFFTFLTKFSWMRNLFIRLIFVVVAGMKRKKK